MIQEEQDDDYEEQRPRAGRVDSVGCGRLRHGAAYFPWDTRLAIAQRASEIGSFERIKNATNPPGATQMRVAPGSLG